MSVFYDFGQGTGGANLENWLAPNYDPSVEWKKGQYCVYLGVLKKCIAPTTGTFDESKWEDDFLINKSGGGSGSDSFEFIAKEYDPAETYNKGDVVLYNDEVYECIANSTTGAWNASKWKRTYLADVSGGMNIDDLEPVLLWTNPSPTANFAAQTVSLDLSGYEGVLVEFYATVSTQKLCAREYVKKGESYIGSGVKSTYNASGNLETNSLYTRGILHVDDNGIEFSVGMNGTSTANQVMIPTKIYGVKGVVVGVSFGDTIWTNPNISTNFAAQTVALPNTVNTVLITFNVGTNSNQRILASRVLAKRGDTNIGASSASQYSRRLSFTANGIEFTGGYNGDSAANNLIIPISIEVIN